MHMPKIKPLARAALPWFAGCGLLMPLTSATASSPLSSALRPEIEVQLSDNPSRTLRGEDLGTHNAQRWVGIDGRAYAVPEDRVRPASLPLNDLISSCLRFDKKDQRGCFVRAGTRMQRLHKALCENLDHPHSPLRLPKKAPLAAIEARTQVLEILHQLAHRLFEYSEQSHTPTRQELERLSQDLRKIVAQLSSLTTLSRGRFGLAVRGGTSMGSYQAGFLYYLSEFLKAHKKRWDQPESDLTGAYQDGLLGHFEVATGTSAGALNALLTTSEGCKDLNLDPTQSGYFQAWINVGMTGRHGAFGMRKHPNNRSASGSFFDPTPIEHAGRRLTEGFDSGKGYQPGCSVDLGITLTRLGNNDFPVMYRDNGKPLLHTRRAREPFAFRLDFVGHRDHTAPLAVRNRRPISRLHRRGLAGLTQRDELAPFYLAMGTPKNHRRRLPNQTLIDTAIASGAMPLAFPARRFDFTAFDPDGKVSLAQSGSARFVDGGVFDNRPLDLAMKLSSWRQADKIQRFSERQIRGSLAGNPERVSWQQELNLGLSRASSLRDWQLWNARADLRRKLAQQSQSEPLPTHAAPWQEILDLIPVAPRTLIFVEPTLRTSLEATRASTQPLAHSKPDKKARLFPQLVGHALNFVDSARQSSLITSIEQHPWIQRDSRGDLRPRVVIPRRSIPIAGEQLYRFMAFFERDFRIFDFFVGLADARRFVHQEDPVFRLSGAELELADPRIQCLDQYFAETLNQSDIPLNLAQLRALLPACAPKALLGARQHQGVQRLNGKMRTLERQAIDRISLPWPQKSRDQKEARQLKLAEANLSANNFSAMLTAMHNFRIWRRAHAAASIQELFDAYFDQVSNAGFQYVDLHELGKAMGMGVRKIMSPRRGIRGRGASKIVRQVLEEAVQHLSGAPTRNIDAVGVSLMGKAAADMFRPYDPEWSLDLGVNGSGLESRLISHPFYDRFRVDWAVLRLHRIGEYTLLSRSRPDLPRIEHLFLDLELSVRLGARLFSMTKLFRLSAMLGPTAAATFNLGGPPTPYQSDLFLRRLGAQLAFELSFLRRIYLEFSATYWMSEHGHKRWIRPGQTGFDWYTDGHSAGSGPCRLGRGQGAFFDCVQTTLSMGWRWDL